MVFCQIMWFPQRCAGYQAFEEPGSEQMQSMFKKKKKKFFICLQLVCIHIISHTFSLLLWFLWCDLEFSHRGQVVLHLLLTLTHSALYCIDTVEYQYSIKIKYCDILTYRYFLTPLVFKCCVSQ